MGNLVQSYKRNDEWKYAVGKKKLSFLLIEEGLLFLILYPVLALISWSTIEKSLSLHDTFIALIPLAVFVLLIYFKNIFLFTAGNLVLLSAVFFPADIPKVIYWAYLAFLAVRSWLAYFSKNPKFFNVSHYIAGQIVLIVIYFISPEKSNPFMANLITVLSVIFTSGSIAYISFVRNQNQLLADSEKPLFQRAFNAINHRFSILIGTFLILSLAFGLALQIFLRLDVLNKNLLPVFPKEKALVRTGNNRIPLPMFIGQASNTNINPFPVEQKHSKFVHSPLFIFWGALLSGVGYLLMKIFGRKRKPPDQEQDLVINREMEEIKPVKQAAKVQPDDDPSIRGKMRRIYRMFIMDRYYEPLKIRASDTAAEIDRAVQTNTGGDIRDITANYEKIRYGREMPSKVDLENLKKMIKRK